jgi:hypothetical protein
MPGTTPIFAFPFPEATDAPAGHTQIEDLADAIETHISTKNIRSAGKSIITATQTLTSVTYAEMGTPDRVEDIVLPTDGVIAVLFHGLVSQSVASAASVAIFVGANQLKRGGEPGAPVVQSADLDVATASFYSVVSTDFGLSAGAAGVGTPVTTGQIVGHSTRGGPCYIFAAAGTYDISVRYKATSGSVGASERRLWAWSQAF